MPEKDIQKKQSESKDKNNPMKEVVTKPLPTKQENSFKRPFVINRKRNKSN